MIAWTTLLVLPMPGEVSWPIQMGYDVKYYVGKSLHLGAYALLTILAGWLQPRLRWRLVLLFFLMAHAGTTEWVQLHVSNRTGTVQDVVLDHIGVMVGLLLSWTWWAKE
jgi:VanZ family protein